MIRSNLSALIVAAGLLASGAALAQEPPPAAAEPVTTEPPAAAPAPIPARAPEAVQVQALSELDLFSTGRDTGLGEDVWKGSSADIARAVIPGLASKPLSPAGASLARRLLAQASTAPAGAGKDLDLAVARARALLVLGDAGDASLVLDRTPGVADHADLSMLAAEAALVSEQDDKACRIADNLTDGRDGLYWLRLRAFCQVRAGKTDEAQLTFNLAAAQAPTTAKSKPPAITRLLGVYIAGAGDAGPASLRDGLDFAVSRGLKLDLTPALATATPALGRYWALKTAESAAPAPDVAAGAAPSPIALAAQAAAASQPDPTVLEQLVTQAAQETAPKARARLQAAAAILASLGGDMSDAARAQFASFEIGRAEAPAARVIALSIAAGAGLKGETVLLALQVAQTGGAAGPTPADRGWIIRALNHVGLKADARAFAVEGLRALEGP